MTTERPTLPVAVEERALAPRITTEIVQDTKRQIKLLQGMVRDLLIRGVDYGRIPGTPQDSLWDPGASQIIAGFNCYPGERRILKFEDSDDKIAICVEVPIIHRETGMVATTGVGAASTLETKHKYRFVDNPEDWGYDEETAKSLRFDKKKEKYRIPNPEHGELLNTIVKMASKRAEVDAAESLPGVASVLRQMFTGQAPKAEESRGPRWDRFWGEVTRLGFTEQEAHQKLGVGSMKDWLSAGRSLDDALNILRGLESTHPAKQPPIEKRNPNDITEVDIPDSTALQKVAYELWGMQPQQLWEELNYTSQRNFDEAKVESPWECFLKLKAVM